MAIEYTPRLKLRKESDDELIDQFEYNWPILDLYADSLQVADGVTPADSDLYEGCLVAERTSGKLWMAVANPASPPQWLKSYISYPWGISVERVVNPFTVGLTDQTFSTILPDNQVNSSAADLVGGKVKIPINGIYSVHYRLGIPALGGRTLNSYLRVNGAVNYGTEMIEGTSGIGTTQCMWSANQYFSSGDLLTWDANPFGGTLNVSLNVRLFVTMISPVWV
jgi:hypothetical protein